MNLDRFTDERLLAVARPPRAGDAFGQFYLRHERLVLGFHMRRTKDAERAADLTAETFERALAARSRFVDRGTGSAVAWLLGIARNVWLNDRRARELRADLVGPLGRAPLRDETLEAVEATASTERILALINQLPASQRDAIRAFVIEDQPYVAIAESLGCDATTLRKRVSRGLASLRANYQEDR